MSAKTRLALSALVPMIFYSVWTYWANQLVTDDRSVLLRSSLSQGLLSGAITLVFTAGLEKSLSHFAASLQQPRFTQAAVAVVPPLFVQSSLTVGLHVILETPNLLLTVTPSIFFSALYGYGYAYMLLRKGASSTS